VFGLFKKKSPPNAPASPAAGGQVKVFLNPLILLLDGHERQKGRPLTREEVLAVRDSAAHIMMPPDQAKQFYESMDSRVPVHRIDPDRVWEEWQEIRDKLE